MGWSFAAAAAVLSLGLLGRAGTPREKPLPDADVVRVTRRTIASTVKATGVVKPRVGAEVRVGSRVSGVVSRLHVRIGDSVERGQLLAELETRELLARRDQAVAVLAASEASSEYAAAELARRQALAAARLLPAADLDLALRARAVAAQQRDEAAASLELARTQLGYSRISAPIAGTVASVATQEGETVAASLAAPTFVTLVDLERLEVWAYVDETDIGRVGKGQAAEFTVDTYPDRPFTGRVSAIYPQAEIRDNVVNYVVLVAFDPARDRTLRPEMTASVRIAVQARGNALCVPRRAVRREGGSPYVLTRAGEKRPVTLGRGDEEGWEIASGLSEGDEVRLAATGAGRF